MLILHLIYKKSVVCGKCSSNVVTGNTPEPFSNSQIPMDNIEAKRRQAEMAMGMNGNPNYHQQPQGLTPDQAF